MNRLTAGIVFGATIIAGGGLAHADGIADPIPQQVPSTDDCIGGTTRWTLQPCGQDASTTVVLVASPPITGAAVATAPAVRLTPPRPHRTNTHKATPVRRILSIRFGRS